MTFDPYHKWLGIATKDQPPNHYRLLAIDLFESDPEVIDAGANRQMAYLQQRATGEHAGLSQKLLNEIAVARLCLLNPKQKAEYDAGLRRGLAQSTPADEELDALRTGVDLSGILDAPAQTSVAVPKRRSRPVFRFSALKPWHYAAAIGGVVVLALACWAILSSGRKTERGGQAAPCIHRSSEEDFANRTTHCRIGQFGERTTERDSSLPIATVCSDGKYGRASRQVPIARGRPAETGREGHSALTTKGYRAE